ncbi:hypothetical protein EPUL_005957, partial [Erysiphe pulchra]
VEADIISKYLQKATACQAASDNTPQPPKIPIESTPGRKKVSNSSTNVRLNNSSLANPKPPSLPIQISNHNPEEQVASLKQKENSWALVARNGHKKVAHYSHLPNLQHQYRGNNKSKKTLENKNRPKDRLFVRLPADHEWRALVLLTMKRRTIPKIRTLALLI